jgi:hypothetical protein
MRPKIRCDEESTVFSWNILELNRVLNKALGESEMTERMETTTPKAEHVVVAPPTRTRLIKARFSFQI